MVSVVLGSTPLLSGSPALTAILEARCSMLTEEALRTSPIVGVSKKQAV
jgi:hypothetical protein